MIFLRATPWGCICALGLLTAMATAADRPAAEIVEVRKIWDEAPHNAFTDLLRHNDRWYCVFREGQAHVSPDGALRVLTSTDGKAWTSAAVITSPDADLRDAKITVAPGNKLMLAGAGALHKPNAATHQSYVWYSDDGRAWGQAIPIGDPNYWIWRIVWHKGTAYGIGYRTGGGPKGTRLFKSTDGKVFETLVPELTSAAMNRNFPNESALLFLPDDTCLCVLRNDAEDTDALLGRASPPYTEWNWKSLGVRVGGPQVIALPDGRIVLGGRRYTGKMANSVLWWLDPQKAALQEIVELPSKGDTSYPGLVWHEGQLWVSYYSSHEGKTSIYLALVKLPETRG